LPSVVEIVAKNADGSPIALGSGFFVNWRDDWRSGEWSNTTNDHVAKLGSGFLVMYSGDWRSGEWLITTNYHVVKDAASITVRIIGDDTIFAFRWEVGWIDGENDLALLKPTTSKPESILMIGDTLVAALVKPPLPIGNGNSVKVGDEVFVVGNPKGFEGTFSQGMVSALRGEDFIQITAPISAGSSGGPVLNRRCEVIGVVTSTAKDGQNLNFAIPAVHLTALLNKAKATAPE
jgi:S1-C subfamily serine protease